MKIEQDNEVVKIFESVLGNDLSESWYMRTPLEKERYLEELRLSLDNFIKEYKI